MYYLPNSTAYFEAYKRIYSLAKDILIQRVKIVFVSVRKLNISVFDVHTCRMNSPIVNSLIT